MAYVREKYDNENNNLDLSQINDENLEAALTALFAKKEARDNAPAMKEAEEKLSAILREYVL